MIAEWVEQSCAQQGVPVKVKDFAVMRQVATLLSAGREPAPVKLAKSA